MTREEYIESVVSQIKDKRARAQAEQELNGHIDDRAAFFTDIGYAPDAALEKALSQMGDGRQTGEQLAKLHPDVLLRTGRVSMILIYLLLVFFAGVVYFFCSSDFTLIPILMDFLVVFTAFGVLLYGLRRNDPMIPVIALAGYGCVLAIQFLLAVVYGNTIVFSRMTSAIYCLLSGKTTLVGNIAGNCFCAWQLAAVSVLLDACVVTALILAAVHLNREKKRTLTLNGARCLRFLKRGAGVCLILIVGLAVVAAVAPRIAAGQQTDKTAEVFRVRIIPPDAPVIDWAYDFYEDEYGVTLQRDYDLFDFYPNIDYPECRGGSVVEYTWDMQPVLYGAVAYEQQRYKIAVALQSESIKILAYSPEKTVVSDSGWLSLDRERAFTFAIDPGEYPLTVLDLTVLPAE